MNTAWRSVPFGEMYEESSRNGLNRPKRVRGAGFKMVNMGELFAYDFISDQPMDLVPMSGEEIAKFTLREGDLLFARQSLVLSGTGKCSIVQHSPPEPTTFESHLIRVRLDRSKADPRFYYYLFRSPQGRAAVQSITMQVAAAGIRASELATLGLPAPPLGIQQKIAAILSAYDDLIENNTRRIALLEEMAQRIYHEWFVEFRYPGHEGVPLVESEVGLAPEGWDVQSIADCTTFLSRGVSPKYADDGEGLVINQKCIRDGKLSLKPARRHVTRVPMGKVIKTGDVLINSTGVGTLGRVAQVIAPIENCTVDSHVTIVRPNASAVTADYWGMSLLDLETAFEAMGEGSTGQAELNRSRIGQVAFPIPSMGVQQAFSTAVQPIRDLATQLEFVSGNLRATRDLLLPRLISGEIDVDHLDIDTSGLAA